MLNGALPALALDTNVSPNTEHINTHDSILNEKMVDIVLDDSADHYVLVSIPQSKQAEYEKNLQDPAFREAKIQQALSTLSPSARALPPGKILSQTYMYKSDIQRMVDTNGGYGTYADYVSKIGTSFTAADMLGLIKLTGCANAVLLGASIFAIAYGEAANESEQWWLEAERALCNGTISGIRYTIVQNSTDYPKVWRVFERI